MPATVYKPNFSPWGSRTVSGEVIRVNHSDVTIDARWNHFVDGLKQAFINSALTFCMTEEQAHAMHIEICRGGVNQAPFISITIPTPTTESIRFLASLQERFPAEEIGISGRREKSKFTLSGTTDTSFLRLFETLRTEYFVPLRIDTPTYPATLKAQDRWLQTPGTTAYGRLLG